QRLTLVDRNIPDFRCLDRLHAALPQGVVDRAGDQVVGHVLEDLVLVTLLDDARRRLARPEARDACAPGVVAGPAVDFGVARVLRNLDAQFFSRFVDVDELGFHRWCAKGGIRTPIAFRLPDPKSGASASSATFACELSHESSTVARSAEASPQLVWLEEKGYGPF